MKNGEPMPVSIKFAAILEMRTIRCQRGPFYLNMCRYACIQDLKRDKSWQQTVLCTDSAPGDTEKCPIGRKCLLCFLQDALHLLSKFSCKDDGSVKE